MLAVTAATGQLGRHVVEALLKTVPPGEIVAAVRSPDKAADLAERGVAVRHADYDRPETLAAAFQDVDRLLLISGSEIGRRVAQHEAAIAAAGEAGVSLIGYTSALRADAMTLPLAEDHRRTEAALKASGVPHAILRHGWYMENYTGEIPSALQHGVISGAAGNGRVAAATRADYAAADAVVLTGDGHAGRTYELGGDVAFTLSEFAEELARQSGKAVIYRDMPEADYVALLASFGLPTPVAELIAGASAAVARGEVFDDSRTLSRLIGRPTTTPAEAIAQTLAALG